MRAIARLFPVAAVAVGLLVLTGCLSTHPGSSSLAYVEIAADSEALIRTEAVRVFEAEHYQTVLASGGALVFEREATRRERVLFGPYADEVMMRVEVSIEARREGGYLVRADAFVVRDGLEDKLLRMSRGAYQSLLNRVKAGLAAPAQDGK